MRPILSSIGICGYNIAKFFLPFLQPLTINEYTVKDSFSFVAEITSLTTNSHLTMASFDIKSLFTNVPLGESIDIVADTLYDILVKPVLSLNKNFFKTLLELSVRHVLFFFYNALYNQINGVGMGNPLGPTLANAFLCHHEIKWLDNCPSDFKSIFYRRYVDDTFILFRDPSHVAKFLDYLNSQHSCIKFTVDIEDDTHLNFLDVDITKTENSFQTFVFRKSNFSGLGLQFDSSIPHHFRTNIISCLIDRAFKICSTELAFTLELKSLKQFFVGNNYPIIFIDKCFKKNINFIYNGKTSCATVPKNPINIKLPFLGPQTYIAKRKLSPLITKFYPHVSIRFIITPSVTIKNFFSFKDKLPISLVSSVIYKYSCGQCSAT